MTTRDRATAEVGTRRPGTALLAAGLAGYALRLVLGLVAEGTNDIRAWELFAHEVLARGLEDTYLVRLLFNHPPLMGLWAATALRLAQTTGVRFAVVFKLPGLAGEVGTGLLLWIIWARRGSEARGRRAFAAYGLALASILISGYHGNTDPLYWFFGLLAMYLAQTREAPFLAGVALGAALDVNLIPVLLVVPLATQLGSVRALARCAAGGTLALAPYWLALLTFSPPGVRALVRNLGGYRSNLELWGVELFVRTLSGILAPNAPRLALGLRALGDAYWRHGATILLFAVAAVAVWQWRRSGGQPVGYRLGALAYGLFLVVGSGFGLQYIGCVIPWLLLLSLEQGLRFATGAGLFIGLVYFHFLYRFWPAASEHLPYPADFILPAFLTWAYLTRIVVRLLRGPAAETPDARDPIPGSPPDSSSPGSTASR